MIDHLTDIASDLSAFHRIDDMGVMEGAVFLALAYRLPAYQGALAAVAAQQRHGQEQGSPAAGTRTQQGRRQLYGQTPQKTVTPRTADAAPPATPESLLAKNTELGARWFSVHTVTTAEIEAAAAAAGPPGC